MTVDRSYVARTAASRERLEKIVTRLRNDDYPRDAGGGWTISAVLAHLAFWDRLTLERLGRWERDGFTATPVDADPINEAGRHGWLAIPGKDAAAEAVAAARVVDERMAQVREELVTAIVAAGRLRALDRSVHRNEHLDQIERALP
jgi:DinB superfamily